MLIPLLANSASTPDIAASSARWPVAARGAVLTAIVGAIKNRTTTA